MQTDNNGQLTFDDTPLWNRFRESFTLIQNGDFAKALKNYNELIAAGADFPEIFPLMKCMKYWLSRLEKIDKYEPGNERAYYLLSQWNTFEQFLEDKAVGHVEKLDYIKKAIYDKITKNFIIEFQNADMTNVDLLINLAEAFIEIHDFQKARDTLIYALKFRHNDPMIFALLGEIYYYLNDQKKSLLNYRKAFYTDAEQIDLAKLNSPVINDLKLLAEEKGFINKEINLWIPIYAALNNIFTYKEKLTAKEYHQLNKKTAKIELKYNMANKSKGRLEPLLINYYIILIDHYFIIQNEADENQFKQKIDTLLRKIKNINETVYNKLRINYE